MYKITVPLMNSTVTRVEKSWMKDSDIEVIAEGDVWPRPRTVCPASDEETFDMAIRAAGCADGIYDAEALLSDDYREIEFINCKGRIEGRKVYIKNLSPLLLQALK